MKSVTFICQNEPDALSCIQLAACGVDENNLVSLTWEWPRDNHIKMVVVFPVQNEEEALPTLIARNSGAVIITKGMEGAYRKPIESEKAIFKLFPARFGENGEVMVYNQQTNNTTDTLYAKISVYYRIQAKSMPFSPMQRVTLQIEIPAQPSFMPAVNVEDLLLYEKNAGGYPIRYPIDAQAIQNGLTLYCKKNEEIQLKPKTPYENILLLHKEV